MSRDVHEVDVLVVGAGASGIYALYALRQAGFEAVIVDSAGGVGGTWYWNRYPGLVVDIESIEYSYAFSDELQQEWDWTHRYAAQPELERYFNHVVDRFDLRKDIHLNTKIDTMVFDEADNMWDVTPEGRKPSYRARHVIMGTGLLSVPKDVSFPGLDRFEGEVYKTFDWPGEDVDFSGKRVGVIGTGASGVQVIPIVAEQARHLYVYQRTPSYAVPLRNGPIDRDHLQKVKANYAEWRQKERFASFGGWCAVHGEPIDQVFDLAMDQTEEEREALYENRWQNGGLAFYNVYPDVFGDKAANDTLSEFLRRKIRERLNDPELEKLLVPDYPVLMRRLAGETNYFEAYLRDNVDLIDIKANPIREFTETGIRYGDAANDLDAVIFATGYDAMSGALQRIDIRGRDGKSLKEHWRNEIRTTFGMMCEGFPNVFFLSGPGSPAPLFQPILFCQDQMDWIIKAMNYVSDSGALSIEPTEEVERAWLQECDAKFEETLFGTTESWYIGSNVDGKPGRGLIYFGGIVPYREFIHAAEDNRYADFNIV